MKSGVVSVAIVLALCGAAQAQSFNEPFDNQPGVVGPIPATWTTVNVSPGGPGTNPNWQVRGDGAVFPAQAGASYAFANFNSSTGANPVDNWLVSPIVTWHNGDTISFWTRTAPRGASGFLDFPDAIQLRLTTTTTTIGATQAVLLADFNTLVLDINPSLSNNPAPAPPAGNPPTTVGFPDSWTQYTVTVSGIVGAPQGRFAFRYFTSIDGGPLGNFSNYLGVDEVAYTVGGGPAPCYANCDGTGGLTGNDFQCFLNKYVAGDTYANCDGVGGLTGNDFQCFLDKYVAGCS